MRQPRLPKRHRHRRPNGAGGLIAGGYIYVRANNRLIGLHGLVMQEILGRPLLTSEHVHHRDGNRQNNQPENLRLLSAGAHAIQHHRKHSLLVWCPQCGQPLLTMQKHASRPGLCCSWKCGGLWRSRRNHATKLGRPAPRPAPMRPIPDPA